MSDKRTVRIAFDARRPPTLEDVFAAIDQVLGPAGCTRCGFDGIDLKLDVEEILGPEPTPWVVTTWEPTGF
jgi:hypothetical protein